MRLLQVVGKSFRDVWNELFLVAGLSILWWLAVVTIVGGPPATTALCAIGYRLAQEKRVNLDFAKEAFRDHFGLSWRLGIVNLVVLVLLLINLQFYLQAEGALQVISIFVLYVILAWLTVLMYVYPLIPAMKSPGVRSILRNAAVIAFANPIYSIALVLILAFFAALSLVVPVLALLLLPGFVSLVSARALADRLEVAEERRERMNP